MGVCEVKARKGLIRASVVVSGGSIASARITGDFMLFPEDRVLELEARLVGARASREELAKVVAEALAGAVLEGSTVDDFVDAILCAAGEGA